MWRPVIRQDGFGGYTPGFDRDAVYEFKRLGSREIRTYRLGDQSDLFNVAGLWWREKVAGES